MAAVSLGGNDYTNRGTGAGGGECSSRRLLTLDPEVTQECSKSFSSLWKPVWCPSWHTGVLLCATSAVVVLTINVSLTIYAATNPRYNMEGRTGTLYYGSCEESKTIGLWLHLGINALSTLLLAGSNYTQQCLAAPTRNEVDAAHTKRRWMDIGVPSVRNLFWIKPERVLLWTAIGFTCIPLHLLYNSAVYISLAANDFFITVVTNNHFEKGPYPDTTILPVNNFEGLLPKTTAINNYGEIKYDRNSPSIRLFSSMLEGYSTSTERYNDLTPLECVEAYNTDFVSNYRNLFLITKHSSNDMQSIHNNTILYMTISASKKALASSWMSADNLNVSLVKGYDPSRLPTNLTRGLPWRVNLTTAGVVEIAGCKSEVTDEKCKAQFSLDIMIVVICCNLVKACSMLIAVVRSREPTLLTMGDAIDSFLRVSDQTTKGMCFADREFIEGGWRRGWRTGPRQWKQNGPQRWWDNVGRIRWVTCYFFCSINSFYIVLFLAFNIQSERQVWSMDLKSMWTRGLGQVNGVSLLTSANLGSTTQAILLSNLPQTILSFLYLNYNALFTCMLSGHEWSLFSHHHRTLRVTSPRPGQRSTYWLQIPYTYAIPLMTLSGLLHWLTSQSIFPARVDIFDPFGRDTLEPINAVGYSCLAMIFGLMLGILALLAAAGMGYKRFAAEITTVGSCSAAISAACHASEVDPEEIIGKKVRWGDVGIVPNLGFRHLTFSSEMEVRKPEFGEVYG